jgi:hypothetical protein
MHFNSSRMCHPLPPASLAAAGSRDRALVAQIPTAGSIARKANAHSQPTRLTRDGIIQMVNMLLNLPGYPTHPNRCRLPRRTCLKPASFAAAYASSAWLTEVQGRSCI